eukprot:5765660-Prymnesium_polylepis.1
MYGRGKVQVPLPGRGTERSSAPQCQSSRLTSALHPRGFLRETWSDPSINGSPFREKSVKKLHTSLSR